MGIGTDSPAAPLDVVSDSSAEIARLRGRSSDNIGTLYFQDNAGSTNYAYIQSRSTYFDIATDTTIPLRFTTNQVERLSISSSGDITPGADATQDLGATDKRFANIYSADLQLSNEGSSNDVDGTWGKYTIQEGEDDLFLINRRTGRKYKFNLTEVE